MYEYYISGLVYSMLCVCGVYESVWPCVCVVSCVHTFSACQVDKRVYEAIRIHAHTSSRNHHIASECRGERSTSCNSRTRAHAHTQLCSLCVRSLLALCIPTKCALCARVHTRLSVCTRTLDEFEKCAIGMRFTFGCVRWEHVSYRLVDGVYAVAVETCAIRRRHWSRDGDAGGDGSRWNESRKRMRRTVRVRPGSTILRCGDTQTETVHNTKNAWERPRAAWA